MGAEPPAGYRGRTPDQRVRGLRPLEVESFLALKCPTKVAELVVLPVSG